MPGRIEIDAQGVAVIQSVDPRDGQVRGTVPCTPSESVAALVAQARDAQRLWNDQGLKRRKWAVGDLHQAFLANAARFAELLAEECGRPAGEAWTAEIVANHHLFKYWLGNIDDLLTAWPINLSPIDYPGKRGVVRLEPKGVLGLITPWNLPVAIPLRALVPAVLAGNAVVFKPSEHSSRIGAFIGELFAKHLPENVVTVVQGGRAQGEALVQSPVDGLIFTGSVRTGRAISAEAGRRMVPVSLELGGKDAAVVLPDADLDRAAAGITWAAFGFGGQNCAAVERCYVHRDVHDALVEKIVARTKALRPLTDVGPLVTDFQLEIVKRHVAQAVEAGATIAAGGDAPGPGLYHSPTVLTGVTEDMTLQQEETFGPVLPVIPYDDLDAVIAQVNSSEFGLTTSVWTRDLDYGEALADGFECGVVTVNNHSFTGALPDAAWTGVKGTGHGVTNSRFALYEMVRPRTVVVDSTRGDKELWWYPYNEALVDVASGMVELSRRGGNRLAGVRTALSGLLNRWKVQK